MAYHENIPEIRSHAASRRDAGALVGGGVLSLGAIIGIAVGGAIVISVVLASILIRYARNRDRKRRIAEDVRATEEQIDFKSALQSTRPPEISFSSCNPFVPLGGGVAAREWVELNPIQNPPRAERSLDQRGFFRISGMRDSWPLNSAIPLAFLPSQQTMMLNQVAPPGYMIVPPETKWPRRSSSKLSQNRVFVHFEDSDSQHELSVRKLSSSPTRRKLHRRSTSESQLSTILRSTSQRLKAAQRHSLTRTLSTFKQLPGWPPSQRLPELPIVEPKAPLEVSDEPLYAESVGSSVYEEYIETSPWVNETTPKDTKHAGSKGDRSPPASSGSDDSLCGNETPDLVIPALLTIPSKRSTQRHCMSISRESKNLTDIIHRNSRASAIDQKSAEEKKVFNSPHRISLASDPFYSSVKSAKPIFPKTTAPDPRPLYVRKATFGQEATPERPLSYTSPLRDVTGNVQGPLKRNESMDAVLDTTGHNPFQWSPQEVMQTRAATTGPKRDGSRKKGHKRSNVIRMSNLPRPQSVISVDVVLEEPESEQPSHSLSLPLRTQASTEPSKTPRPLPAIKVSRRLSLRPPSSDTFNPPLVVPELNTRNNSPTLGDTDAPSIYSPTLSVCNYYTETSDSENEFFQSKRASVSEMKLRRHGRNYSVDFPAGVETLISFPSPPGSPPIRPLSSITTSSAGLVHSKVPSPAPPVLTMPIPGHLTGPRPEPPKRVSDLVSPPRNSLQTSVGILRRMNSEVSHYSIASVVTDDGSPCLPAHKSYLSITEHEEPERGRSRGSKHYLSMGQTPPQARDRRVAEKRDSHRIYKERRLRRMNEESLNSDDLTPVREHSSPATEPNALNIVNLRFPTISSSGITGATPPSKSHRLSQSLDERWSDGSAVNSVRRESQMEHPSPQTPPKWGWGNKGLGIGLVGGKAVLMDGKENSEAINKGRPESLGLYDQDGFLKSSPGKEKLDSFPSPGKDRLESGSQGIRSFVM